jgi:hypothetical protein
LLSLPTCRASGFVQSSVSNGTLARMHMTTLAVQCLVPCPKLARTGCEGRRRWCLLTALFGSVINVFLCTSRAEPGSHVRILKAKCCAQISWFSVPVCARVSRYAISFSSQIVELFAARLHHNIIVHTAPPRIGLHYSPTSLTNMISQNSGSQIESFPLPR